MGEARERPGVVSRFLNNFGYTLYLTGDLEQAQPKVTEALALARDAQDTWHVAVQLDSLADIEFAMGDLHSAELRWKEVLELARDLRGVVAAADALGGWLAWH